MNLERLLGIALDTLTGLLGKRDEAQLASLLALLMPFVSDLLGTQEAEARAAIQIEASRLIRKLGL